MCVRENRVVIKDHFADRLAERGLFWGDVLQVLDAPDSVAQDGYDEYGRERWFVSGMVAGQWCVEILCVIETDGPTTLFITLYWEH